MPPDFFEEHPDYEAFFNYLQKTYPQVYVFIAVSPSGRNLTKPLEFIFEDNKVYTKQLRTRHRNSYLLSALLIHLTYGYNDPKYQYEYKKSRLGFKSKGLKADSEVISKYHCLSPLNDLLLESSQLPNGSVTLWFHRDEGVDEIEALRFFRDTYMPEDSEVLVSPSEQNLAQHIHRWCVENNWDVVTHGNATGSERDLVIAFVDNNYGNLEVMSRARKRLIIVTK